MPQVRRPEVAVIFPRPDALVKDPSGLFTEQAMREAVESVADGMKKDPATGKVSAEEVDAFVRQLRPGLTFEALSSARWWFDNHRDDLSPQAQDQLQTFIHDQAPSLARPDPVTGVDPSFVPGEPVFSPAMAQRWGPAATVSWSDDGIPLVHGRQTPQQVGQSKIGDCYLLTALNAVNARVPGFVRSLIHQDGNKVWTIFYVKGEGDSRARPVKVETDDLLPVVEGEGAGVRSADVKEDWPALYEKLWAKFRGGYDNIEGGLVTDVFAAMTGHTPRMKQVFADSSPTEILAYIKARIAAGDAVSADSYGADGAGNQDKLNDYFGSGLVADHCYAVLGTVEREGRTYIRIQNPWGKTADGPFAWDSAKYPKRNVTHQNGKGTFDITPQEFVRWFANVGSVALQAQKASGVREPLKAG